MLFDTHTHLDQAEFDEDRDDVVQRGLEAGVERIVAVGTTAAASRTCVDLAARYVGVSAAVGIQPNCAAESKPSDWAEIERLATLPGVVAIGETGLDRYWDETPFEQQQDFFDRHIALARQLDLPFIVHMRDCEQDILDMLVAARRQGPLRGVMHSFTGSAATVEQCLEMGLHISFAGMVTYKKSQALRECAATVPSERLLIETDSPYLSPEPVRSKRRNEPAHVRHIAARLAEVRGVALDQLAAQTTLNACELFRLE